VGKVIKFPSATETSAVEQTDTERRLMQRYGVSQRELHNAIKPLAMLMYQHGMVNVSITRDGSRALVTVDGKQF
jgi:hypothetical protein